MAVLNFNDAFLSIGGIDLSDHIESVKLEVRPDMLEKTAMSDTEHRFQQGLQDWSLEVTFYQDYAGGSVDATLWALVGAASGSAMVLRPDSAAKGAANPKYTATLIFEGYEPLTGGVGTLQKVTAKFRPDSALARAV